jgi:hypothetical protein
LRKQNLSIYDISRVLEESGQKVSAVAVSLILKGLLGCPKKRRGTTSRTSARGRRGC